MAFHAFMTSDFEMCVNLSVKYFANASLLMSPFSYSDATWYISNEMILGIPNFNNSRSIAGLSRLIKTSPKSNIRVLIVDINF